MNNSFLLALAEKMRDLREHLRDHESVLMAAPLAGLLLGGVRGARLASRQYIVETLACPPRTHGELTVFMKHRHLFAVHRALVQGTRMAAKFGLVAVGLESARFAASEVIDAPLMADMTVLGALGAVAGVHAAHTPLQRLISATRYSCFGMLVGALLNALEGLERSLESQFRQGRI